MNDPKNTTTPANDPKPAENMEHVGATEDTAQPIASNTNTGTGTESVTKPEPKHHDQSKTEQDMDETFQEDRTPG